MAEDLKTWDELQAQMNRRQADEFAYLMQYLRDKDAEIERLREENKELRLRAAMAEDALEDW